MTNEQAVSLLEELRSGNIQELKVEKEEFLTFRQALMKAEDVSNFRGRAKHHGMTIYTYEPNWA
ncbi:hypothetical protein ACI2JA_15005 [Alkalihalobacillus sp. NPDC078783]